MGYVFVGQFFGNEEYGKLPGVGSALLGFAGVIGGVHLTRAVRGGWRESFDVHRHGLVHHGWRMRRWTWREVTTVRVRWKNSFIFGEYARCVIRFDDGARVCVDGHAADGDRIARIVVARCPAAVRTDPSAAWRLVPFLIPFFVLTSAGSSWYYIGNYGRKVELAGPDSVIIEPFFSDGEKSLFALVMIVNLFGLFFAIYGFTQRPRRR